MLHRLNTPLRFCCAVAASIFLVPSAHAAGDRAAAAFEGADSDKDGRISRDEYVGARDQRFAKLDRNGDGSVSDADFPRADRRPKLKSKLDAFLAEADTNGDGAVTREELTAAPTPAFDKADTNSDGFVDQTELAAVKAMAAQARQARQ